MEVTMRTESRQLLLLAGLLAAVPAVPAVADRPITIIQEADDTFIDPFFTDYCGAPVEVHLEAKWIFSFSGNTMTVRLADVVQTYTNLDTGASIVFKSSGVQTQESILDADAGLVYVSFRGAVGTRIVVPRQGAVFIDAGLLEQSIIFAYPSFEIISFESTPRGRHDALTPEMICMLLAG
jgi:hypothetical protein